MQAFHIFAVVLSDKSKGPKKIHGHLIQVPSVRGTGAKYIIYLKTVTLDVCGSRSAAAASSHAEEWNMKQVVKQALQKV